MPLSYTGEGTKARPGEVTCPWYAQGWDLQSGSLIPDPHVAAPPHCPHRTGKQQPCPAKFIHGISATEHKTRKELLGPYEQRLQCALGSWHPDASAPAVPLPGVPPLAPIPLPAPAGPSSPEVAPTETPLTAQSHLLCLLTVPYPVTRTSITLLD